MEIFLLQITDHATRKTLIGDAVMWENSHLVAAVVIAESEKMTCYVCAGRVRDAQKANEENDHIEQDLSLMWSDPSLTSCKKLGTAEGQGEGLVLADYLNYH